MIVSGMLIEQNGVDGAMMHITNVRENITDANSYYYEGTIPEERIAFTSLDSSKA